LAIIALVLLLRLPFLNQAIQGDDVYYLAAAEHAQIDPLHPNGGPYVVQGALLDLRGYPHPPLNAWVLAALLAALGDAREVPFHLAYTLFSLIAALAMYSLARRFCEKPFLATLLFLAVPAFVVNGNSLESDLPFLAFWMAAIALFVIAVHDDSRIALLGAAVASVLAALAAYQAIFLAPVLAVYLIERRPRWLAAWCVALAAPVALGAWQVFERVSGGALPASVLAGYMQAYNMQALAQKVRNAAALVAHSGWIVSPVLVRGTRRGWIGAAAAAIAAAFYDPNPMFWGSFACGVLVLVSCFRRDFLGRWALIFFAGALIVFFAGSARYLLPIAAPVAILAARSASTRMVTAAFALQMAISLGLAVMNYQHWNGYRRFAALLPKDGRIWVNGEWGLRYYLESAGGLPLTRDQALAPGDIVVTSELALPIPVNAPLSPLAQTEIRPWVPLRIISLDGRSAYSVASRGLRPFEFSTAVVDRVRAGVVTERKPELTWIDPRDPKAAPQIISGLFSDGWMTEQATVQLKRPERPAPLRAAFVIPPYAPARHVRLLADGQTVGEDTFPAPGSYALTVPFRPDGPSVTVTLSVDKTFSVPPDQRKLGILVTGIGFDSRPSKP
jgi:4-amino-4-deoxy-L-arabinose transferase-like glycosyltransferase